MALKNGKIIQIFWSFLGPLKFERKWAFSSKSNLLKSCYYSASADKSDKYSYCTDWIARFDSNSIPKLCCEVQYIRSSGPGGQNVNKLNTKCSFRVMNFSKSGFNVDDVKARTQYQWIPDMILHQLLEGNEKTDFNQCNLMKLYYKPLKDCLIIQSDSQRSRHLNEADCFLKLKKLFEQGFHIEKELSRNDKLKWEKIKERENNKRLKEKRFKKMQKELKKC